MQRKKTNITFYKSSQNASKCMNSEKERFEPQHHNGYYRH